MSGVHDTINRGDVEGRSIGKRMILSSSFTGSPRYMYKHYQDALALCHVYGNPQYFITFTCNAQWPEVKRELSRIGCTGSNDQPDIIARDFDLKVKSFIKYLKTNKPGGPIEAGMFYCFLLLFIHYYFIHCHSFINIFLLFFLILLVYRSIHCLPFYIRLLFYQSFFVSS